MKRTWLTDQSTVVVMASCAQRHTHMHMDSPYTHSHEHTLTKGGESTTVGSCCHFHPCQVGEQPAPKELPGSGNAAVWPAHGNRRSRHRHASQLGWGEGGVLFVIITNPNRIKIKMEFSDIKWYKFSVASWLRHVEPEKMHVSLC